MLFIAALIVDAEGRVHIVYGHRYRDEGNKIKTNLLPRTSIVPNLPPIKSAISFRGKRFFLDVEGQIWAEGSNVFGRLGLPLKTIYKNPQVVPNLPIITAIFPEPSPIAFLDDEGFVWVSNIADGGSRGNRLTYDGFRRLDTPPLFAITSVANQLAFLLLPDGQMTVQSKDEPEVEIERKSQTFGAIDDHLALDNEGYLYICKFVGRIGERRMTYQQYSSELIFTHIACSTLRGLALRNTRQLWFYKGSESPYLFLVTNAPPIIHLFRSHNVFFLLDEDGQLWMGLLSTITTIQEINFRNHFVPLAVDVAVPTRQIKNAI